MNLFDAPPSYAAQPTGDGTVSLTGTVKAVRCYKEESGWAAVTIETDGGTVSATGIMRGVREGMTAELAGRFEQTRYGTTLRASSFVERLPSDIPGIEKYLASGLIKNIGPVLAKQITQTFGERTLDVLDNEPERLCEVHGIGAKRLASLVESLREQKAMRGIMIWLKRYGISNAMAAKIYKTWGDESLAKLEENPYRLADDINGVGFHKADEVATSLGIPHDSTFRIRSGLKACLEEAAANGNTCMPQEALVEAAAGMLALDGELVDTVMKKDSAGTVTTDDTMAYLPRYLKAEKGITDRIVLLVSAPTPAFTPDFGSLKEATGLDYSQEQHDAVLRAATSGVLVITGGPGTGKTATTNAIIRTFEQQDRKVLLAAPTGRAAKRMEEVTGRHAKTIHRLLEFSYEGFARNGDYPLEGDALIVDESSMIDTLLMDHLLKAVPAGMKLILVGDVDQLPSVGAGSVLRDIIDSGTVPTVRLTQIYRQAQGSAIIMGAHEVNRGLPPRITNAQDTDLWLFRAEERETVADLTIDLVRNRIPAKFGIPPEDIQVLTPMRRDWDPIGAAVLNARLQEALNPDGELLASRPGLQLRTGDRIMQVKNNYDKEIFNGDIGRVTGRAADDGHDKAVIEADFDGRTVRLTQTDLSDIELAYACTIHKSQGSEHPAVVMPMHQSHYIMLKRNLLYTGITRAKRQCVIVGNYKALEYAAAHEDTARRCTTLRQRLEQATSACAEKQQKTINTKTETI